MALPETNKSQGNAPENGWDWKTIRIPFWVSAYVLDFSSAMLVSGRVSRVSLNERLNVMYPLGLYQNIDEDRHGTNEHLITDASMVFISMRPLGGAHLTSPMMRISNNAP